MKMGWLVWDYEDTGFPTLFPEEPDWHFFKIVKVVYAEVIE